MRTPWWWMFAALALLTACEEETADEPEAVAPVEVTSDQAGTQTAAAEGEPDVVALQARVAELERQLQEHHGAPAPTPGGAPPQQGGTQVATVPEGVDVPDDDEDPHHGRDAHHDDDDDEAESASSSSGGSSSRRRRGSSDQGLLGALLGDDDGSGRRRRRRRDEDEDDADEDEGPAPLNPFDLLGR